MRSFHFPHPTLHVTRAPCAHRHVKVVETCAALSPVSVRAQCQWPRNVPWPRDKARPWTVGGVSMERLRQASVIHRCELMGGCGE